MSITNTITKNATDLLMEELDNRSIFNGIDDLTMTEIKEAIHDIIEDAVLDARYEDNR